MIYYKKGGSKKYVLEETYWRNLSFRSPDFIYTDYGYLQKNGRCTILKGYEWDGPSGPAIDTKDFMEGSLVHDFLYQLMREGKLPRFNYRRKADREMRLINKEAGMPAIRRLWTWLGVRIGGHCAAGGKGWGKKQDQET